MQLAKVTQTRENIKKTLIYHEQDKNKQIGHLIKAAEVEQKKSQTAIKDDLSQQKLAIMTRIYMRKLRAKMKAQRPVHEQ